MSWISPCIRLVKSREQIRLSISAKDTRAWFTQVILPLTFWQSRGNNIRGYPRASVSTWALRSMYRVFCAQWRSWGLRDQSTANKSIGSGVRLLWFYHLLACDPGQVNQPPCASVFPVKWGWLQMIPESLYGLKCDNSHKVFGRGQADSESSVSFEY